MAPRFGLEDIGIGGGADASSKWERSGEANPNPALKLLVGGLAILQKK